MPNYVEYLDNKFEVLSFREMDEYLQSFVNAGDLEGYAGDHCGYGMKETEAKALAEKEKKERPEEEWSISTHLTDWGTMFDRYPQLKSADTYDNEFDVMGLSPGKSIPSELIIWRSLPSRIFNGASEYEIGKHNGIMELYAMMRGIKEEKWAEMPEFAHYAKEVLRKSNLPLPVPRTAVPTRDEAAKMYKESIKGDAPTPENLRAMLGILAVKEPFDNGKNNKVATVFYDSHPDYNVHNSDHYWVLYKTAAHPILTAATVFELSKNEKLMEYLNSKDAVKEAKAGTLYEAVQEHVYKPEAEARAEAAKAEAERKRLDEEKRREDEKKAQRGQLVQQKRSEDLLALLKRLGVSEADLSKKPDELKVPGSTEYNNMTRAALAAYQSASGDSVYDINHDKAVREACFAYTKGKKSVRMFESGRNRFEACLDLMMSVSEPTEEGVFPDGIVAEFNRINEVRKTKPGDANYVSPHYFKFAKNQITVQEALDNLHNHPYLINEHTNKLDEAKYSFVYNKLKETFPQLPGGGYDGRAIVDNEYFRDCYGLNRGDKSDRLQNALQEYQPIKDEMERQRREDDRKWYDERMKQRREEEKQREEERKQREEQEKLRLEQEKIKAEETKKRLDEENQREQIKRREELKDLEKREYARIEPELKEQQRKMNKQYFALLDKENAKRAAAEGGKVFSTLLTNMPIEKQAAANAKLVAKYRSEENCEKRAREFDERQRELSVAWEKAFAPIKHPQARKSYAKETTNRLNGQQSGAAYVIEMLDKCHISHANAHANFEAYSYDMWTEKALKQCCSDYACVKLFKPDEKIDVKRIEEMADTMLRDDKLSYAIYNTYNWNRKKMFPEFNMTTEYGREAQERFDEIIRENRVQGLDYKGDVPEQKIYAGEVQQKLLEVFKDAAAKCSEVKKTYNADETCMPDELHAARDMAIRATVAGHLARELFPDPDAEVDLKKLNEVTEKVVNHGEYMAGLADMDVGMKMLKVIRTSCDMYIHEHTAEFSPKRDEPVKGKQKPAASAGGPSAAHQ